MRTMLQMVSSKPPLFLASNRLLSIWNIKLYPEQWDWKLLVGCLGDKWIFLEIVSLIIFLPLNTVDHWYPGHPDMEYILPSTNCCVCGGGCGWASTSVFCEAQWHRRAAYDRLFCSPNSKGVLASSLPHSGPTSTACPGLLLWLLLLLELIPTILFLLPSLFHFFLSPVGLSCSLPPVLWFILLYLLGVEFCLTTKEGWGFN